LIRKGFFVNKYDDLSEHLSRQSGQVVEMKFSEIESIINDSLPSSARKHRAWWSNNPSNSVITHAWLNAGFQTEKVDMAAQRLLFRRVKRAATSALRSQNAENQSVKGSKVTVDLSELSQKSRKWLEEEASGDADVAATILKAVERHASRMQRLAIIAKYEDAAIGSGSDSLDLIKEGRDER
jgi:hypothetical protein